MELVRHALLLLLLTPTLGMVPVSLGTLSLSPADLDEFMAVVPRFGPFVDPRGAFEQ